MMTANDEVDEYYFNNIRTYYSSAKLGFLLLLLYGLTEFFMPIMLFFSNIPKGVQDTAKINLFNEGVSLFDNLSIVLLFISVILLLYSRKIFSVQVKNGILLGGILTITSAILRIFVGNPILMTLFTLSTNWPGDFIFFLSTFMLISQVSIFIGTSVMVYNILATRRSQKFVKFDLFLFFIYFLICLFSAYSVPISGPVYLILYAFIYLLAFAFIYLPPLLTVISKNPKKIPLFGDLLFESVEAPEMIFESEKEINLEYLKDNPRVSSGTGFMLFFIASVLKIIIDFLHLGGESGYIISILFVAFFALMLVVGAVLIVISTLKFDAKYIIATGISALVLISALAVSISYSDNVLAPGLDIEGKLTAVEIISDENLNNNKTGSSQTENSTGLMTENAVVTSTNTTANETANRFRTENTIYAISSVMIIVSLLSISWFFLPDKAKVFFIITSILFIIRYAYMLRMWNDIATARALGYQSIYSGSNPMNIIAGISILLMDIFLIMIFYAAYSIVYRDDLFSGVTSWLSESLMVPLNKLYDMGYMLNYERGTLIKWILLFLIPSILVISSASVIPSTEPPWAQETDISGNGSIINEYHQSLSRQSGYVNENGVTTVYYKIPHNKTSKVTFYLTWTDDKLGSEPDTLSMTITGPDGIFKGGRASDSGKVTVELTNTTFPQMDNLTSFTWTVKVVAGNCGDYSKKFIPIKDNGNPYTLSGMVDYYVVTGTKS